MLKATVYSRVMGKPNQHGRTGGRGLRPWFLIPKVVAVATLFGSLVAFVVISFGEGGRDPAMHEAFAATLGRVYWRATVPALAVTMVCGWLLFMQHPVVFWRMRWIKTKSYVGSAAVVAIASIGWTLGQLQPGERLEWQNALDLTQASALAATVLSVVVIWLGRHKPRLGQTPGPPRRRTSEDPT